jgi:hypothetical protein
VSRDDWHERNIMDNMNIDSNLALNESESSESLKGVMDEEQSKSVESMLEQFTIQSFRPRSSITGTFSPCPGKNLF